MPLAIETHALCKSFGSVTAVHDLNLSLRENRITAFLGRNGAGKSTTIKMALGMVRPTAGKVTVLGAPVDRSRSSCEIRRRIAYVAENKPLYGYLTVKQTIGFARSFYSDWQPDLASKLVKEYELPLKQRVKSLSKGMRTKLALLLAFARRPDLLILDEPSEGLDPVGIEQLLRTMAVRSAEGVSVLFSSHQISEIERVADHICILEKGALVLDAGADDLRQSYRRVDLVFRAIPDEMEFHISGVEKIRTSGCQMSVLASRNADAIIEMARGKNAVSVAVEPVGLRDIFLQTVEGN